MNNKEQKQVQNLQKNDQTTNPDQQPPTTNQKLNGSNPLGPTILFKKH